MIPRGVQYYEMKILLPLNATGFDALEDDEKKEAETAGEEIVHAILYLENSDKYTSAYLEKRVENNYVLNKVE